MITLPRTTELTPPRAAIAARLEQEYETHSERLAGLLTPRAKRRSSANGRGRAAGHGSEAIVSARRALSDIAQALRRLAEGTFGSCEHCLDDIPLDDLERNPAARWCRSCGISAAY